MRRLWLARWAGRFISCRVNTPGWVTFATLAIGLFLSARAQTPAVFTRPGTIVINELIGSVQVVKNGSESAAVKDQALRAEVSVKTGRRSSATLEFSNGSTLQVGVESETLVEEYWQLPHSQSGKMADWKVEPSASRATLRLVRGDLSGKIMPLKVARGSSFTLELVAGTLRITEGDFSARVQMTSLGLGICVVEMGRGGGEFEPAGGKPMPLTLGKRLAFAVEQDPRTGAVKVEPAPEADVKR